MLAGEMGKLTICIDNAGSLRGHCIVAILIPNENVFKFSGSTGGTLKKLLACHLILIKVYQGHHTIKESL